MDFLKKASQSFGGQEGEANLVKEAQGFLGSKDTPSTDSKPTDSSTTQGAGKTAPSSTTPAATKEGYGALFGNAQTLYQGLQDKVGGKQGVDDAQLAAAAQNVLDAAEKSGIDKDGQYSDYFKKADSYLKDYGSKGSTGAAPTGAPAAAAPKSTESAPESAAPAPAGAPAPE